MTENTLTLENTDNNAYDSTAQSCPASQDTRETIPEKTFTQSKVEELIAERLKRERKNAESLRSVKDLLFKLSDSGVIKSSSYSDMANELCSLFAEKQNGEAFGESLAGEEIGESKNGEGEDGFTEEKSEDETCSLPYEPINKSEETPENAPEYDSVQREKEDVPYILSANDARAIKKAYPECDIGELLCDEAFEKFAQGKRGTAEKIYGEYLTFMTVLNGKNESIERRMFAENASTSFSASDKAYSSDGSEGLTKRQMEIARESGMSYREYSSLLSDIPKKRKV